MPRTFNQCASLFKNDKIVELSEDEHGLRFLKLRSLSRKDLMEELALIHGVSLSGLGSKKYLQTLFDSRISSAEIDDFINTAYDRERSARRSNEDVLVSELYKIRVFDWGGLHQNSLEKTIVDNYVKKIQVFDTLNEKIENDLHHSMRAYVLCSWYNHWTSILIEDLFKDHASVLPAVGLIKKVDFFIDNIPFDLKVTYLPEGFVKEQRRLSGIRPESTLLKRCARQLSIHFDDELTDSKLLDDLWTKIKDHPSPEASRMIDELHSFRMSLINDCTIDPVPLIKWLYENQGIRRFDSSNRLFLVLIDSTNFFDSWKLKRAKPKIIHAINAHLNNGHNKAHEVSFVWEGETYTALSDVIFVIQDR